MRFKSDLVFGQGAEKEFNKRFPSLTPTDGRKGDFTLPDGSLLELKSDRYDPATFRNYIMERYSSDYKPGGPWQAAENGVKYFAYDFPKYGNTSLFLVSELVPLLEEIIRINELSLYSIDNGTHVTRFYKIKMNLLVDIKLDLGVLS